jgi:hypothetical protein
MAKFKLLLWLVALVLLFSGGAALADEEGVDYGYWCTSCGRQHGPGESCPSSGSSGGSGQDEPYDWSQPVYTTASPTTTTDTSISTDTSTTSTTNTTLVTAKPPIKGTLEERKAKAHKQIKNIQPLGTSVVDLRDKKGALVVNPSSVKGPTGKPRSLKIKEPPVPGSLSDKELSDLIGDMLLHGKKAGQVITKQRIFEKNPDKYLTNPLRTKENDAEYVAARKRYVKEADDAIFAAQLKLLEMTGDDMRELWRKSGSKDYGEFDRKCDSDPALRQKSTAILNDYRAELQIVTLRCNEKLQAQMAAEDKKFYQRHPELKN